jgi:hypothetical protein
MLRTSAAQSRRLHEQHAQLNDIALRYAALVHTLNDQFVLYDRAITAIEQERASSDAAPPPR